MAGLDTPVHPSTIGSERYDACQKAVRKDGYWAKTQNHNMQPPREMWAWVQDRGSVGCRYDLSLADPKCEGCKQRGVGVEYDQFIRRMGT